MKNGLDVARINWWAVICWPSSQARVKSEKSLSSLEALRADPAFSWKLFHFRQSFSELLIFRHRRLTTFWISHLMIISNIKDKSLNNHIYAFNPLLIGCKLNVMQMNGWSLQFCKWATRLHFSTNGATLNCLTREEQICNIYIKGGFCYLIGKRSATPPPAAILAGHGVRIFRPRLWSNVATVTSLFCSCDCGLKMYIIVQLNTFIKIQCIWKIQFK